jgi:hypothetical protein
MVVKNHKNYDSLDNRAMSLRDSYWNAVSVG